MTDQGSLAAQAIRETVELHEFFQEWLRPGGRAELEISRLERALDAGFRLIGPDGGVRERGAVVAWIKGARGSRAADFTIGVAQAKPVWQTPHAVLLEYVETQYGHSEISRGKTTRRQSTALFCREPSAPCGVAWRHLQETWLQDQG